MLTRTDAPTLAAANSSSNIPVHLAVGDYDRTRPLIDGRVKPVGLDLTVTTSWIGHFCLRPVYEEYDAAEMSLSWYVMARMRQEPVIALPIFVLRMPVHAYVFVREDSHLTQPSQLIGGTIASTYYRLTVNLWLRGIFQEHYGLAPEQTNWVVTSDEEGAGFVLPPNIKLTRKPGLDPFDLLEAGEVDAVYTPEIPERFVTGRSKIRRLFPDAQAEAHAFSQRVGYWPMTHTIVVGQRLADRKPQVVQSLIRAFRDAQRVNDEFWHADAKNLAFPDAIFFLEQQRKKYGLDPYQMGVTPNRKPLDDFVRYAHQQGYIDHVPLVDDLFVPEN